MDITIEKPFDEIFILSDKPDHMTHWQTELTKYEYPIEVPDEPGFKTRLTYQSEKRTFDIMEVIIERNFPVLFRGSEANGTVSEISNEFIEKNSMP